MIRQRRQAVSSAPPQSITDEDWSPPEYPKTDRDRLVIREAVNKQPVLFGHLSQSKLNKVIGAMFSVRVKANEIIIEQGDLNATNFYVIQNGSVDFHVKRAGDSGTGDKVGSAGPGSGFGELALLYGSPRAATVIACQDCLLWALDRDTFRTMLTTSENTKKRTYEEFLENIFKGLNRFEVVTLCDMMSVEAFRPGQCIVRQGEVGRKFYVLEKGAACAVVDNALVVHSYTIGGYFGELALIGDDVRKASVYARSKCRVLSIDKATFDRVLGPMLSVFKGKEDAYKNAILTKQAQYAAT